MPLDEKGLAKAPFPWFGGRAGAAELVWKLLGDVHHYVEPFFGGGAVLLRRPHPCNRTYVSETINDADGFVVNFWRAVQLYPVETATAASWPVSELDKQARQIACLRWLGGGMLDRLAGDAMFCDPVIAGWWAYGVSCQIGNFMGPWTADPITGEITRAAGSKSGISCDIPHISNDGQGVNRPQTREPGVLDPARLPEFDSIDWGERFHGLVIRSLCAGFDTCRLGCVMSGSSAAIGPGSARMVSCGRSL